MGGSLSCGGGGNMESEGPCLSDMIFVGNVLWGSLATGFVIVSNSSSFLDGMDFSVPFVGFSVSDEIMSFNLLGSFHLTVKLLEWGKLLGVR